MKTAIFIIPTYNEKDNIAVLLRLIESEFSKLKHWRYNIVIIDDFSPDNTTAVIKKIRLKQARINIVTKEKEGLGSAYIKGFKYVIKYYKNVDCVFQMDADLSHNPNHIIDFINEFEKGSDFIIGSRYTRGSRILKYPKHRLFISRFGNYLYKWILNINNISDFTSGYRCISLKILKRIDFDKIKCKSYAIMPTLLLEVMKNNVIIKEIPIIFINRKRGKSKMRFYDCLENIYILLFYFGKALLKHLAKP